MGKAASAKEAFLLVFYVSLTVLSIPIMGPYWLWKYQMPKGIKAPVGFGFRYGLRLIRGAAAELRFRRGGLSADGKRHSKTAFLRRYIRRDRTARVLATIPAEEPRGPPDPAAESLAKFLHLDILMLVSQHLHFQDLVSLSATCRVVHDTVFPPDDRKGRMKLLRLYCCDSELRADCWTCGVPVCKVAILPLPPSGFAAVSPSRHQIKTNVTDDEWCFLLRGQGMCA
jgi:hypothetical protein